MKLSSFLAMLGLALSLAISLPGQTVRVIFVAGQASLQRPDEPALRPAAKGDSVVIGTRIVTGADGRVILTPMPGVKSIVAPNTTLVLESASETRTSDTNVTHAATLDLKEGAVTTDLNKPEGVTYDYNIRTARGLAGARGTTFTVGINAAGIQTIVVAHGTISVNFTDGSRGTLSAGKLSITKPSGETKSVGSVGELSADDQKIAQKWVETTIAALATALDAGIEIDPAALQNALDAAKSLGITLSPETQTLVDRVQTKLVLDNFVPPPPVTNDNTEAIKEAVTEVVATDNFGGFASIADFQASLSPTQLAAFNEILELGGFSDVPPSLVDRVAIETSDPLAARKELEAKLKDPAFVNGLLGFIDYFAGLPTNEGYSPEREVLTGLGILGNGNLAVFGVDVQGLQNLLNAYTFLDAPSPVFLYESDFSKDRPVNEPVTPANVFFNGANNNSGKTIYNVTFDARDPESGDPVSTLRIGATRQLVIDNTGYDGDAFIAGYSYGEPAQSYGRVELRASDLVSLNSTRFGPNVTSILIEAATINLANVDFRIGTSVELNSKLGELNFGSSQFGYVNFIKDVKYGGTVLTKDNFYNVTDGYIQIGTINRPRG